MQKIQLITKKVTAANELVRINEELDRDFSLLSGIAILDNVPLGSSLTSCSINGKDVLPKGFEVLFLQSSNHVAPSERFFPIEAAASGNKLEIAYQDGGLIDNYPYTLRIYLALVK